jgi:hypothetical protein
MASEVFNIFEFLKESIKNEEILYHNAHLLYQ